MGVSQGVAAPAKRPEGRLLKVLGVAFGAAVIVGNTIGAGILRTPGDVAGRLPSEGLFLGVWVVGGVMPPARFTGVELETDGPRRLYHTLTVVDWEKCRLLVVGGMTVATCGSAAAIAIVIGEYLAVLFPARALPPGTTAAGVVILLAALQLRGIRWGDRMQQITSLFKTLALTGLVAAIFWWGGSHPTASALPAEVVSVPHGAALVTAMVLALQGVIYTYDGWNGMVYFSEEA